MILKLVVMVTKLSGEKLKLLSRTFLQYRYGMPSLSDVSRNGDDIEHVDMECLVCLSSHVTVMTSNN